MKLIVSCSPKLLFLILVTVCLSTRGRRQRNKPRETRSSPPTWAPSSTRLLPPAKTWRRLSEARTHTRSHTLARSLWTPHTLVVETNLGEKSVKKKTEQSLVSPLQTERWIRQTGGANCSGDFNGQLIYLYLFIHILFIIGCADWLTGWLIVGLLTVQDASALWAAVSEQIVSSLVV